MPSNRLLAIITVLTCLGAQAGAQSGYTIDQLRAVERLVIARDCAGLRRYLDANPILLIGSDPLSAELRAFAAGVDSGLIECLSLTEADRMRQPTLSGTSDQIY